MQFSDRSTRPRRRPMGSWLVCVLGAVWCALFAFGAAALSRHTWTPGSASRAPMIWPADSRIVRVAGARTLLFFAHPQCPCTRTSLAELGRIVARHPAGLETVVVIYHPVRQSADWSSEFRRRAERALPSAVLVDDMGLRETVRFGVGTSGETMLYSASGELKFQGGVTAGRGHAGENLSSASLSSILAGGEGARHAPVFGCSLGLAENGD